MEFVLRDIYSKIESIISKYFIIIYNITCKPCSKSCVDIAVQNVVFYASIPDMSRTENFITLYVGPNLATYVHDFIDSYNSYLTGVDNDINIFNIKKTHMMHMEIEVPGEYGNNFKYPIIRIY